jgi:sulfopyruvate decarboxylase subunit beta
MTGGNARIPEREAIAVVHTTRRDADVVIATMSAARDLMSMSTHPLDFIFVPSSMGHATSFGLGLALAQPARRVIVCNGDGSMLMNLGSLVSITAADPPNLVIVVCDNGVYEVTGSQPTAGSPAGRVRGDRVDLEGMARACGFRSIFRFSDLAAWQSGAQGAFDAAGPVFVLLDIEPLKGVPGPRSPGPAAERARQFMKRLARAN